MKLLKKVENIVANGVIACFEQLLLLPQCFQKSSALEGIRKRLYVGKWFSPRY